MKKLSLFFKLLATGSATMLLAACYGTYAAMYGMPVYDRSGSFQIIDSDTEDPIEGLKVSYEDEDGSFDYTDSYGMISYNLFTSYTDEINVIIEDVDDSENGMYPALTVKTIDADDDSIDVLRLESE